MDDSPPPSPKNTHFHEIFSTPYQKIYDSSGNSTPVILNLDPRTDRWHLGHVSHVTIPNYPGFNFNDLRYDPPGDKKEKDRDKEKEKDKEKDQDTKKEKEKEKEKDEGIEKKEEEVDPSDIPNANTTAQPCTSISNPRIRSTSSSSSASPSTQDQDAGPGPGPGPSTTKHKNANETMEEKYNTVESILSEVLPDYTIIHQGICDAYVNIVRIARGNLNEEQTQSIINDLKAIRHFFFERIAHSLALKIHELKKQTSSTTTTTTTTTSTSTTSTQSE